MLAYTRYVLDAGMRGDLLALKVALPLASSATPRSRRGSPRGPMRSPPQTPIASGSPSMPGGPIRKSPRKPEAHLEELAGRYATPAREAELIAIFKEATRLEADFWEMGWRAARS